MENNIILPLSYYQNSNVIDVGKDLLGKYLFTNIENKICGGMIVETESYLGFNDKACHAHNGKKTKRTLPMFQIGGVSYIYLCYGMYHLLNVVTNKKDIPDAVLIRAIEPVYGIDTMLKRRKREKLSTSLTAGPGILSIALGITLKHNNLKLTSPVIWIEDRKIKIKDNNIIKSPRVNVSYAKEDALLPYRFRIKNNIWTSRAK